MFDGYVVIYADGGCLNNGQPDPVAYGSFTARAMRGDHVLKYDYSGRILYPQHATNNAAEFQIIIDALDFLLAKTGGDRIYYPVTVYSDSQLLVNGVNGTFSIGAPHLVPLLRAIQDRVAIFDDITFTHIKRDEIVKVLGH